jgi:L-threonylcarbamoyladenylate synthase
MAGRTVSIERDGAEAARSALERIITEGGVAVFPADGLYGLACDPANAEAIERIHVLKGREERKPSAVMYFSGESMEGLLQELAPLTRAAIAELLPGPATLVVFNPKRCWPLACREDLERLGVRWIDGPLAGVRPPVFQTSANRSGEPAAASYAEVPDEMLAGADLAIDGGQLSGVPSTVIDLTRVEAGGPWEILRQGGMPHEELERKLTELDLG